MITVTISNFLISLYALCLWLGKGVPVGAFNIQATDALAILIPIAALFSRVSEGKLLIPRRNPIDNSLAVQLLVAYSIFLLAATTSVINADSKLDVFKTLFSLGLGMILMLVAYVQGHSPSRESAVNSMVTLGALAVSCMTLASYYFGIFSDTFIGVGGRSQATFSHPNQLAIMLAASLPFTLIQAKRTPIFYFAIIVQLIALALTGSKANLVVAIIIAITSMLTFLRPRGKRASNLVSYAALTGVLGIGAYLYYIVLLSSETSTSRVLDQLLSGTVSFGDISAVQSRLALWQDAMQAVESSPIIGIGLGNSGQVLAYEHAHNVFVDLYLTTGLFGLLGFSLFVIVFLRALIRSLRNEKHKRAALESSEFPYYLAALSYLLSNQTSDSFGGTTLPIFWISMYQIVSRLGASHSFSNGGVDDITGYHRTARGRRRAAAA